MEMNENFEITEVSDTDERHGDNITSEDYKNLTEDQAHDLAESQGVKFRVTSANGTPFFVTTDHVVWRINAAIQDGKVSNIDIES